MDNVRNLVGHPIAGIDPEEIVDTRPYCHDFTAKLTNNGKSPLLQKKHLAKKKFYLSLPPHPLAHVLPLSCSSMSNQVFWREGFWVGDF